MPWCTLSHTGFREFLKYTDLWDFAKITCRVSGWTLHNFSSYFLCHFKVRMLQEVLFVILKVSKNGKNISHNSFYYMYSYNITDYSLIACNLKSCKSKNYIFRVFSKVNVAWKVEKVILGFRNGFFCMWVSMVFLALWLHWWLRRNNIICLKTLRAYH